MKTPRVTLSNEDAVILQQINESGEEDIISLEQALGMHRGRLMARLEHLRRKGLITIQRTAGDWWVQVSSKGKQVAQYIWPEASTGSSLATI